MCDQLTALATSPYGNNDVISPNLGRLAARGTLFRNAYCNAPLCAPSRASMMTGLLPNSIPVNDNFEELPASVPTFAHYLRRGGYRTILSGKMHFVGPDQLHGFEERLTTDIYPSDMQGAQDWQTLGDPPRQPGTRQSGRYMARMITEAGPVPWSAQLDYDEEVHFRALERIRQLSRTPRASRPWCLCVSYTQPHDPYAPAREYWDLYEGREITLPEQAPAAYKSPVWDEWVNAYQGVDTIQPTAEGVRTVRRAYYAMVTYIDEKLGELCRELERFGQLQDTIVFFLSDHGDMLGEHGMYFKRSFREWSTRVPLIVAGPGVQSGREVSPAVSLVDILPTVLSMAGIDEADLGGGDELTGSDLFAVEGDARPAAKDDVIIDYNGNGVIAPTRTLVCGGYKYVYVHGQEELLYNLAEDPGEWANLAREPSHRARLASLREQCLSGWDPEETLRQVVSSQRRRIFLDQALRVGQGTPWDFQPRYDATRVHVRRRRPQPQDRSYSDQADPRAGSDALG